MGRWRQGVKARHAPATMGSSRTLGQWYRPTRVTVGQDQQRASGGDRRRRTGSGLGRAHTFVLGIIAGTFVVAPLGSTLIQALDPEPPPPINEDVAVQPSSPAEDDEPEVTAAIEAVPELTLTSTVPLPPTTRVTTGEVQPNEFVAELLVAAGATQRDADLCARALAGKFDFRKSRPGHAYEVEVDLQGQVLRFEYKAGPDEIYQVDQDADGAYIGRQLEVELVHEVVPVFGEIEVSLWEAFVASGESPNLAMALAEAFRYDIDFFHDTRKGDRFRFFVDKYTHEGELVRYGRIWAAEYIGAEGSPVGTKQLYWWEKGSKDSQGYYDQHGHAAQRAFLRSPLKYTRVSSPYGYRHHPVLGRRHFHGGVDYAAPVGTPVQAVAGGTVTWARAKGPAGNMVRIRHSGGYESYYLHLSAIHVSLGQNVTQSTVVGKVGSTGRSTGPHLDFRLKKDGRYINPRQNVAPRTKSVPKGEKKAYLRAIEPWSQQLTSSADAPDSTEDTQR